MILEEYSDKEIEELKAFAGDKGVLIVDPNKILRTSLKKICVELGFSVANIESVELFSDAEKMINDKAPEFVFTYQHLKSRNGTELLAKHIARFPNRSNTFFAVISDSNSPSASLTVLDSEADAFIGEPFTVNAIAGTLVKELQTKLKATPMQKKVWKIKEHIFKEDFDVAKNLIAESKGSFEQLDTILYLDGFLERKIGNDKAAIECFNECINVNKKHYKALKARKECYINIGNYSEAYNAATQLLEHYPIDPVKLPELIKLSLANQKFEDIIKFANFFAELEDQDPNVKKSVAASLAMCGKFLLISGDRDRGIQTLDRATKLSDGRIRILSNIIDTLLSKSEVEEAFKVMKEYNSDHGKTETFQVHELEAYYIKDDMNTTLSKGTALINNGIKHQKVFEIVIKSSIQVKRKDETIDDLIFQASKVFPDKKAYFESLWAR